MKLVYTLVLIDLQPAGCTHYDDVGYVNASYTKTKPTSYRKPNSSSAIIRSSIDST